MLQSSLALAAGRHRRRTTITDVTVFKVSRLKVKHTDTLVMGVVATAARLFGVQPDDCHFLCSVVLSVAIHAAIIAAGPDRVAVCSVRRVRPDHEVRPGAPGRAGEEGQQVADPQPLEEGAVVRAVRHQV